MTRKLQVIYKKKDSDIEEEFIQLFKTFDKD